MPPGAFGGDQGGRIQGCPVETEGGAPINRRRFVTGDAPELQVRGAKIQAPIDGNAYKEADGGGRELRGHLVGSAAT